MVNSSLKPKQALRKSGLLWWSLLNECRVALLNICLEAGTEKCLRSPPHRVQGQLKPTSCRDLNFITFFVGEEEMTNPSSPILAPDLEIYGFQEQVPGLHLLLRQIWPIDLK